MMRLGKNMLFQNQNRVQRNLDKLSEQKEWSQLLVDANGHVADDFEEEANQDTNQCKWY